MLSPLNHKQLALTGERPLQRMVNQNLSTCRNDPVILAVDEGDRLIFQAIYDGDVRKEWRLK